MGRADDRARAVPRDGIPAADGGARRRRQPRRGAPRVRALPTAPRGGARRLPVTRDRVDLPRPARSAAPRAAATTRCRRPETRSISRTSESRPAGTETHRGPAESPQAAPGRLGCGACASQPPSPRPCCSRAEAPAPRPRRLRRLGRDLPPRRAAARAGRSRSALRRARSRPASGSIWVANADAHSVSRIDPAKQVVIQTIQVGNGPAGIAFGGGFVWVANGLDGTVSRIDPRTDTVVQRIRVGNGPAGVAVDSRGRLGRELERRHGDAGSTGKTGKPLAPIRIGQSADGVAAGDGSVWVTSAASGKREQDRRSDGERGRHGRGRERRGCGRGRAAARSGSRTASTAPSPGSIPPPTPFVPRSPSATARTGSPSRAERSG